MTVLPLAPERPDVASSEIVWRFWRDLCLCPACRHRITDAEYRAFLSRGGPTGTCRTFNRQFRAEVGMTPRRVSNEDATRDMAAANWRPRSPRRAAEAPYGRPRHGASGAPVSAGGRPRALVNGGCTHVDRLLVVDS